MSIARNGIGFDRYYTGPQAGGSGHGAIPAEFVWGPWLDTPDADGPWFTVGGDLFEYDMGTEEDAYSQEYQRRVYDYGAGVEEGSPGDPIGGIPPHDMGFFGHEVPTYYAELASGWATIGAMYPDPPEVSGWHNGYVHMYYPQLGPVLAEPDMDALVTFPDTAYDVEFEDPTPTETTLKLRVDSAWHGPPYYSVALDPDLPDELRQHPYGAFDLIYSEISGASAPSRRVVVIDDDPAFVDEFDVYVETRRTTAGGRTCFDLGDWPTVRTLLLAGAATTYAVPAGGATSISVHPAPTVNGKYGRKHLRFALMFAGTLNDDAPLIAQPDWQLSTHATDTPRSVTRHVDASCDDQILIAAHYQLPRHRFLYHA